MRVQIEAAVDAAVDVEALAERLGVPVGVADDPATTHVLVVRRALPGLAGLVPPLWDAREGGEVVVLARPHLPGAAARLGSWLSLDTRDATSPLHLLTRRAADDLRSRGVDLQDPVATAVGAALAGWRLHDVRLGSAAGGPAAKVRPRGVVRSWSARNSIDAADYDMRAFTSRLAPQRRWQQRRHALTTRLLPDVAPSSILNVGAGSGRLALDLPGSVSVDVVHTKLRYMRRFAVNRLTTASAFQLPFADGTFACVVCCEVIEHVPMDPSPLAELVRVLAPGGRLIISTPDYGTPVWPLIEKVYAVAQPHGYADEHISHYTTGSLVETVEGLGLQVAGVEHLYRAIVIAAFDAPAP